MGWGAARRFRRLRSNLDRGYLVYAGRMDLQPSVEILETHAYHR